MRFRAPRFAFLCLPSLLTTIACGDEAPIYPPIVIIYGGGSGTSGPNGTGSGNGTGNNGNDPTPSGGASSTGGSNGNAGSSSDPNTTGLFAHCGTFLSGAEPKVETACDLDKLEDGGELTGDVAADRTLKAGHFYTLKGGVRVMPGKTLTIEPCVKVMGESPEALLLVMSSSLGEAKKACTYAGGSMTPGGKLVAVGEPMAPIIFTSTKPVGQRSAGDWGGVIILGNAQNDLAQENVRVPIEGLTKSECHGYHTGEFNAESSGQLAYVRIEYASRQIKDDNETNALTLGSVGSGTEIHHVMVSNSADDCFEWFGGTVNADHLIALNCDDDSFDADNGYSGKLQFLFGRQYTSSTETEPRGLEISQGDGVKAMLTSTHLSNVTLCGNGPKSTSVREHSGADFRGVPEVHVMNTFMTGFSTFGIQVRDLSVHIDYTHLFNQKQLFSQTAKAYFDAGTGNSADDPDRFCDCWANPPAPVPATPVRGGKPTGFADEDAAYVGAFADGTAKSNWMKGAWVDWSDK
jgi:hypothetical protein